MGCTAHPDRSHDIQAARCNVDLGLHYLKQGQISRCKSKILRAEKLAPQLPEVHSAYGLFLETVGENLTAKKAYLKAIRLAPDKGEGHHYYGAFLCRQQQYDVAEKAFIKAIADPYYEKTAEVYENASACLMAANKPDKAVLYLEKAKKYKELDYSSSSGVS